MRLSKTFFIALALGAAAACSDSTTDPNGGATTRLTLNGCTELSPWFAYQNTNGAWTQVTPNANGQIVFDATEKVSVAVSAQFLGVAYTQIVNATAAELQGSAGIPCETGSGQATMNGTITGLTGEQFARITAAGSGTSADAFDGNWLIPNLPATPVDLVATRYSSAFAQPATRIFIRRAVVPSGSSATSIDFNSTTLAAALESQSVTFTGLQASGSVQVLTDLITANGTTHSLGELSATTGSGSSSTTFNYVSVPASLRLSTDQHLLAGWSSTVDGVRSIAHYYRTPATKSFAFGPILSTPTITTVATTPVVRPRLQLASQTEYPSAVIANFYESTITGTRVVSVVTTAAFLGGTPQTWDLTVPDLSAAGYSTSAGLQSSSLHWTVTAQNGSIADIVGAPVADNSTIVSATRASESAGLGALRKRGANAANLVQMK